VKHITELLSFGIALIGIAVIIWGVIMAFVALVQLEIGRFKGMSICSKRDNLRHHLGSYLLLGLEFLVAADVIHTILHPELEKLTVLGGIVVIRTVLSFFLNLEMKNHHKNCNK
jgi:uncharacterized membrane protein